MFCLDVKAVAAYEKIIRSEQPVRRANLEARRTETNTAAPKLGSLLKLLKGHRLRRPGSRKGKAEVPWEETTTSTMGAAGVWVLASKESFSEITSGRSYFQLG